LDDLNSFISEFAEFDATFDRAERRSNAVRRVVSILDRRAARAEEVTGDLVKAEKRLSAVESEVADLRSRLLKANLEIAKLRSVEEPATRVQDGGMESYSGRSYQHGAEF